MRKVLLSVFGIVAISSAVLFGVNRSPNTDTSMACDMPSMQKSVSQKVSNNGLSPMIALQNPPQDPPPPEQDNSHEDFGPAVPAQQQPETDKHCERPNPNGQNPDVGGTDHDKIGCSCARKCDPNTNKPSENYDTPETRCKVHCKPEHCDCPNPCAKT